MEAKPYGLSVEVSREHIEDDMLDIWDSLKRAQKRAEEYRNDMLTLSVEEMAEKYPPPPEPEICECCGQVIDDY